MLSNLLFVLVIAFFAPAHAQDLGVGCNVTVTVTCPDCVNGQKWDGDIFVYNEGVRAQVAHVAAMESGKVISSGNLLVARRILAVNGQDFATFTCDGVADFHGTAVIDREFLGVHALQHTLEPAPVVAAPVVASVPAPVIPTTAPDSIPEAEDDEVTEETVAEPPPTPVEPSAPPPVTPVVVSVPASAPVVDYSSSVVAHNVGWGAPGGAVLWLGNDGDYASAPLASRRGHFTSSERYCPAGKIPLVQGTAAQIDGGIPAQVSLDDRRATDVAPPDWNGEYVGPTGTTILGKDAAGIYCVEPNSIIRREPAAMAAVIQPAQPPGVTPEALRQALEDQANQLREELKPDEPPATVVAPKAPLLTRGGPFTGIQWSVGQPNAHWLLGGFVTLRLSDRIWFEPWVAVGTDGKSTHPSGWDEEQSAYTETTGTYLSISGGVSFPVVVWEGSQGLTLLLTPSLGWVGDDLTAGVTTWGDTFSLGAQAELWWGRKVPFAIYAEAGVGVNAWLNDQEQHQWAARVPVKTGIKVPF